MKAKRFTLPGFAALLLPTLLTVTGTSATAAQLRLTLNKIEQPSGTVRVAVYNRKEDFRHNILTGQAKTARPGQMFFVFSDLAPGEYAVMVYHDINDNEELDKNFLGIPREPWGGSMNGNNYLGPPPWGSVNFALPAGGKAIRIEID